MKVPEQFGQKSKNKDATRSKNLKTSGFFSLIFFLNIKNNLKQIWNKKKKNKNKFDFKPFIASNTSKPDYQDLGLCYQLVILFRIQTSTVGHRGNSGIKSNYGNQISVFIINFQNAAVSQTIACN